MNKFFFDILQRVTTCIILLLSVTFAFGQSRTITGKITDARNGKGIPGVSVVFRGTTAGTTSSADGSYSINVPQSAQSITFSSIGFGTQEIALGSSNTIIVSLQFASTATLDEVVVVGYGTQRRKEVTPPLLPENSSPSPYGGVTLRSKATGVPKASRKRANDTNRQNALYQFDEAERARDAGPARRRNASSRAERGTQGRNLALGRSRPAPG